jgi:transposase
MERYTVVILDRLGIHRDLIHLFVQRDPRSVQLWIDRFAHDWGLEDLSGRGRDPVLSEDESAEVVRIADQHPFMVPRDIKHTMDLDVSARTIRRVLDDAGLYGRIARHDFSFTEEHLNKRLAFAREYQQLTAQDWARVVFADEAWLHVGQSGKLWVQRPVNHEFDPKFMAVLGPPKAKVGVWLAFSAQGTFTLFTYQNTMNMDRLQTVFTEHLLPEARPILGDEPIPLLQDNARYHVGRKISAWYKRVKIAPIGMPPYSPDLNPTENLINILKQKIEVRNPQDVESLTRIAIEEWGLIKPGLCRNLATSMINRIQCVLECDGHRTGY